jgi:hypothetical protein
MLAMRMKRLRPRFIAVPTAQPTRYGSKSLFIEVESSYCLLGSVAINLNPQFLIKRLIEGEERCTILI